MRNGARARRRMQIAGVLLVPVLLGACSKVTGTKAAKASRPAACTYVAKLDTIANTVAHADVTQPDVFKKTLDTAVRSYVANVRLLRAVAPADLQTGLDRVEADVQQYRFDAALTDRADLDAYAARECGRAVNTAAPTTVPTGLTLTPTTSPTTASTAAADATGSTTTTAPSDG